MKALAAAIAAGGWVAVVVVVVICLVALIACSCFGIFFSSEDTGSEKTMRQVIQEINMDYQNELDAIKDSVEYDALEMSGSRAVWNGVPALSAGVPTSAAISTRVFARNLLDVKTVCNGSGSVDSGLTVLLSLSPE